MQKKNEHIGLIIFGWIGLSLYAFSFVFFDVLNSIAAIVKMSSIAIPISFIIGMLLKEKILQFIGDHEKKGALLYLVIFFFVFYISAFLNMTNRVFDKTTPRAYEVFVLSTDTNSTKTSLVYYAQVNAPIDSSCCFIPDSLVNIRISKSEYEAVIPGKSKVFFVLKNGFLKMPWIVSKKFIP